MAAYLSAQLAHGDVNIIKKELPELDDNTVVIKIFASGICRADVKEVSNSRDIPEDRWPLFGHEVNGIITSAGKNTGFEKDLYVAFNPNITNNRTTWFAEYMIITDSREKLEQAIFSYDKKLDPKKTILAEPFACIVHSLDVLKKNRQIDSFKDKEIAIIGAGNSGMLFGLLAKHYWAKIKIFNIDDGRLEFAQQMFPKEELSLLSETVQDQERFDAVVICPTRIIDSVLRVWYWLVKPDWILHVYGGTRAGDTFLDSNINIDQIRRNESIEEISYKGKSLYISGAYGFGVADFRETFDMIAQFPVDLFISKEIDFDTFSSFIMDMASGKTDYPGKVIVKF